MSWGASAPALEKVTAVLSAAAKLIAARLEKGSKRQIVKPKTLLMRTA